MNASEGVAESLNFGWLVEGEIAGCAAPAFQRDLDYLRSQGIRAILRLAHPDTDNVMPQDDIMRAGLKDLPIPVRDFTSPTPDEINESIRFLEQQRANGKPVAVSCGAGCGRTGTILACHLITRGYSADAALDFLLSRRPCCREIVDRNHKHHQKDAIFAFEKRFAGRRLDC